MRLVWQLTFVILARKAEAEELLLQHCSVHASQRDAHTKYSATHKPDTPSSIHINMGREPIPYICPDLHMVSRCALTHILILENTNSRA